MQFWNDTPTYANALKMSNNTQPYDVDMVYLWVNGNDPAWRAKRNALTGVTDNRHTENCEGRYADHDELRYSLRSLHQYAPWIRRIFIVTDNQVPAWLNTDNPKIRIVDHSEILPSQSLPCFNSNVIEHGLHRIPGLAEHFIYGNDDTYINRPVTPATFFDPDGRPIARMNRRPLRRLKMFYRQHLLGKPVKHYNEAIENSLRLVQQRYGKYFGCKTHHNIDAYLRSSYEHVADVFSDEIGATMANHLRSDNDIQRNIYSYVPLAEGTARLQYVTQHTSFRLQIHKEHHYRRLDRYNPLFFCMNDSEYAAEADRRRSADYLMSRFPDKSPYEKD